MFFINYFRKYKNKESTLDFLSRLDIEFKSKYYSPIVEFYLDIYGNFVLQFEEPTHYFIPLLLVSELKNLIATKDTIGGLLSSDSSDKVSRYKVIPRGYGWFHDENKVELLISEDDIGGEDICSWSVSPIKRTTWVIPSMLLCMYTCKYELKMSEFDSISLAQINFKGWKYGEDINPLLIKAFRNYPYPRNNEIKQMYLDSLNDSLNVLEKKGEINMKIVFIGKNMGIASELSNMALIIKEGGNKISKVEADEVTAEFKLDSVRLKSVLESNLKIGDVYLKENILYIKTKKGSVDVHGRLNISDDIIVDETLTTSVVKKVINPLLDKSSLITGALKGDASVTDVLKALVLQQLDKGGILDSLDIESNESNKEKNIENSIDSMSVEDIKKTMSLLSKQLNKLTK